MPAHQQPNGSQTRGDDSSRQLRDRPASLSYEPIGWRGSYSPYPAGGHYGHAVNEHVSPGRSCRCSSRYSHHSDAEDTKHGPFLRSVQPQTQKRRHRQDQYDNISNDGAGSVKISWYPDR